MRKSRTHHATPATPHPTPAHHSIYGITDPRTFTAAERLEGDRRNLPPCCGGTLIAGEKCRTCRKAQLTPSDCL